ncbi:hypothetical protein [Shouchella clausii]|uniref:hypothetical protein n=1 Tax=Shouchella clausii TaxID=79880 RepID=UPI00226D17D7|nr:hypothetical protein [Shouchella clausii]MCY1105849.1 hypothetical protein [Shouchella clausii]
MTLDERIKYTSEQHNVSVENIHDALNAYVGDWPEEKTLEAIGVLGDGGIHGKRAGFDLTTISRGIALKRTLASRCILHDAGLLEELPEELAR